MWACTRLAFVLLEQGAHATAYREFMKSLVTARELDFRPGFSWSLDGLAHLAARRDIPHLAGRLAAVASSVRAVAGIRLSPQEQTENDRLREQIRAAIGSETDADTWANGERWTVDEVIATVQQAFGTMEVGGRATTATA